MSQSINHLKGMRDDLLFILDILCRQELWDKEELGKRGRAIKMVKQQIRDMEGRLERAELQRQSAAKLSRWLNRALHAAAMMSVLYVILGAQIKMIPTVVVGVVFAVAIFKASPNAEWKRVALGGLVPLAIVLVLFSVAPLRSYLEQYNTDMALLGLLYALMFAVVDRNV